jgi:hypothetical protein
VSDRLGCLLFCCSCRCQRDANKYYLPNISVSAEANVIGYVPSRCPLHGIKDIHFINIENSPDALKLLMLHSGLEQDQFHNYAAVSHRSLHAYPELLSRLAVIFKNNLFGSQTQIMARALNHFALWKHIATTTNELHVILEDSVEFDVDWILKWNSEFAADVPKNAFVSEPSLCYCILFYLSSLIS